MGSLMEEQTLKLAITIARKAEASVEEIIIRSEHGHLEPLDDPDFMFVLLCNALKKLIEPPRVYPCGGKGYPLDIPVEAIDALREELDYCLLGGTN